MLLSNLTSRFLVQFAPLVPSIFTMTDVAAQNMAYFNKIANEYDQKNVRAITELEKQVGAKKDFIGIKQGDRFLDYACGTGMLSRVFSPYLGECVGIDLSENMVGAFNAQAQTQGASRTAYQGNLADASDPNPQALSGAKFFNFDVAGVGLGWHHFEDCELATQRLAERLKPGGVLFIVDFVTHEMDTLLAAGRGVTQHGFSEEQMRAMFEKAGLSKDFAYEEFPEPINFSNLHGEDKGDGHGHGHNHGHDHGHGGGRGGCKGHDHNHGGEKKVFIARATKL